MADEPVEIGDVADDSAASPRTRALAAVLAVLVALNLWAVWNNVSARRSDDRRDQMIEAGRVGLLALTSIDHERVDQDVQRILDSSTGSFRDDFAERAEPFKDAARRARSKSAGAVSQAALESDDGDSGSVLVALTVMTSNRGVPEQYPKAWRTRVTVTKDDGAFKVAAVEFVQ